jgi:ribonuclease HI
MQTVEIYTDGACSGNPGPGGWGAVLVSHTPAKRKELSGAEPDTTNNRMELMAAIEALEILKRPCRVALYTDSKYLCEAFRKGWLDAWQKNGWKTRSKTPVKNRDLWQRLLRAAEPHEIDWHWVKGHNEHPGNERADRLAVAAREALAGA